MADDRSVTPWELAARQGRFEAIPDPFLWRRSAAFAHLLNAYDTIGFDAISELANSRLGEAEDGTGWHGTAYELWLCLFFEHRRERHGGLDLPDKRRAVLDSLCAALRENLQTLKPAERSELLAALERFPFPGTIEALNGH